MKKQICITIDSDLYEKLMSVKGRKRLNLSTLINTVLWMYIDYEVENENKN